MKKIAISDLPVGTKIVLKSIGMNDAFYSDREKYEGKRFVAVLDPEYTSIAWTNKKITPRNLVFYSATQYKIIKPNKVKKQVKNF